MKKGYLAGTIAAALLMVLFVLMTAERAMAVSGTAKALDTIEQGLDWDGTTKISTQQQTDRINANLDVLVRERSQRNTWGGLALFTGVAAVGLGWMTRKHSNPYDQSTE
jgi:di/tricarboxylate transporter